MAETTKENGWLHSDVDVNIPFPLDRTVFLDLFRLLVAAPYLPDMKSLLVCCSEFCPCFWILSEANEFLTQCLNLLNFYRHLKYPFPSNDIYISRDNRKYWPLKYIVIFREQTTRKCFHLHFFFVSCYNYHCFYQLYKSLVFLLQCSYINQHADQLKTWHG